MSNSQGMTIYKMYLDRNETPKYIGYYSTIDKNVRTGEIFGLGVEGFSKIVYKTEKNNGVEYKFSNIPRKEHENLVPLLKVTRKELTDIVEAVQILRKDNSRKTRK